MAGELVVQNRGRAMIVADALDAEADQRKLLGEYVAKHMVPGTDYGVIPGTKNRTLYKPGAEKLAQLFRCSPRYILEGQVENWDTGLFHYRFRCEIVSQADGVVVAEGVGSCSTYESRYRWRAGSRKCPMCGAEAIIKGKAEYGGGWVCFKKKDGCGAKFSDDDSQITGQPVGRIENPDLLDCVNTVLKMAKKRSLVDAAISLARCSDLFTQDVEDDSPHEDTSAPTQASSRPQSQPQARSKSERLQTARDAMNAATDKNPTAPTKTPFQKQVDYLDSLLNDCRENFGDSDVDAYLAAHRIESEQSLTPQLVTKCIEEITAWRDNGVIPAVLETAPTA